MVKKGVHLLVLALVFLLGACAGGGSAPADVEKIYQDMLKVGGPPAMLTVPPEKAEYIFGIMRADCARSVTAVSEDGMLADEIWLLEAVDSAAAARLEALARARLEQKAAETKDYAPAQYQIVQKGQVVRRGNCVFLLVSAQQEALSKCLP